MLASKGDHIDTSGPWWNNPRNPTSIEAGAQFVKDHGGAEYFGLGAMSYTPPDDASLRVVFDPASGQPGIVAGTKSKLPLEEQGRRVRLPDGSVLSVEPFGQTHLAMGSVEAVCPPGLLIRPGEGRSFTLTTPPEGEMVLSAPGGTSIHLAPGATLLLERPSNGGLSIHRGPISFAIDSQGKGTLSRGVFHKDYPAGSDVRQSTTGGFVVTPVSGSATLPKKGAFLDPASAPRPMRDLSQPGRGIQLARADIGSDAPLFGRPGLSSVPETASVLAQSSGGAGLINAALSVPVFPIGGNTPKSLPDIGPPPPLPPPPEPPRPEPGTGETPAELAASFGMTEQQLEEYLFQQIIAHIDVDLLRPPFGEGLSKSFYDAVMLRMTHGLAAAPTSGPFVDGRAYHVATYAPRRRP